MASSDGAAMPRGGLRTGISATRDAKEIHSFAKTSDKEHREGKRSVEDECSTSDITLSKLWMGISARRNKDGSIDLGFACHDGTYSVDFAVHTLPAELDASDEEISTPGSTRLPADSDEQATTIADYVVHATVAYQQANGVKFLGAGLSGELVELSPQTSMQLWRDLDIVPIIFGNGEDGSLADGHKSEPPTDTDELADSLARKCVIHYGPSYQPRVQIGFRNLVEVDLGGRARMATLEEFQKTVTDRTWNAAMKYTSSLKQRGIKFAFFSATPQGGGVALMRHALIRFFQLLGVSCSWWVPKPKPEVFRITKMNHNILQGVAPPDERLTVDQQGVVERWVSCNAERFWSRPGGPLAPRSEGGVDVIIVDDPQMPGIIDIAKKMDPDRPVIFRSHIQIRSDLAAEAETATAGVWRWLWKSVKHADLFLSHPVKDFVPQTVSQCALAYMPATTDWLDGLNKDLGDFEGQHYINELNEECMRKGRTTLDHPKRDYIAQIARFDPSKGIPHALAAYAEFRRTSAYCQGKEVEETPQLVLCGHGSVDDPDSLSVLNRTLKLLETTYADVQDSVVVVRLGPSDQLLNAILSNARVALQLSTREGFEVKVSEALHKGTPVVATTAGGIPLQVQHGKAGYLVEPGDVMAVAGYLDVLFSDERKHQTMSRYAATHVSDEVGTVGNAVCWMYLVDRLSRKGEKLEPMGQWVWDIARNSAGEPKDEAREEWLPRDRTT